MTLQMTLPFRGSTLVLSINVKSFMWNRLSLLLVLVHPRIDCYFCGWMAMRILVVKGNSVQTSQCPDIPVQSVRLAYL